MANPELEPQILTSNLGLLLVTTWLLSEEIPLRKRWDIEKIYHISYTHLFDYHLKLNKQWFKKVEFVSLGNKKFRCSSSAAQNSRQGTRLLLFFRSAIFTMELPLSASWLQKDYFTFWPVSISQSGR